MATKRSLSTTSYLPPEIIFEILLHLPPKDLIRFMRVCKAWNTTISSQEFIKAQHDRSIKTNSPRTIVLLQRGSYDPCEYFSLSVYFDRNVFSNAVRLKQPLEHPDEKTLMLGYCNGLVCIKYSNSISNNESFVVWNPSIQRFKRIPFTAIELPADTRNRIPKYGFGYDSTNDDYKLVRVVVFTNNDGDEVLNSEVKIYSLKSNSWKRIQSLPCIKDFQMYSKDLSFLNGALHCLIRHRSDSKMKRVLSLDLATEKYDDFPAPQLDYDNPTILMLEILGGYLCVCPRPSPPAKWIPRSDVWIMKEYGVTASWTRLCTIKPEDMPRMRYGYCKPLLFSKTREMILFKRSCATLFWYDLEKKRAKQIDIFDKPSSFSTAICVGNLRLLDGEPVTVRVGEGE